MSETKKVISNSIWIIICRIIKVFLAALVSVFTARLLGASDFGLINYAASLVSFISPLVLLGFNSILVKELLNDSDEGLTLGTAIISCMCCAIIGIATSSAISWVLSPNDLVSVRVVSIYSIMLLFHATEMIQYWFQAKYRSKTVAIVGLVAYFAVSVYKVLLLFLRVSIYWFALSNALDYLLISVVLVYIYFKDGNPPLRFSNRKRKQMMRYSVYYAISAFMVNVFTHVDSLMIKTILGNVSNGIYAVAITSAGMFTFVFVAILEAMRPYILKGKQISEQVFERRLKVLYAIFVYLGILCGVIVALSSNFMIRILYGAEYADSANVLKILIWNTILSCIGGAKDVWILAEQKQKYLLWINAIGVVCNVLLNILLIPVIGIIGAAIATVVTQFTINILMCLIIVDLRQSMVLLIQSMNPKTFLQIFSKEKKV